MSVQNVGGGDVYGKLALQWLDLDPTTTARISVQIATNGDFTENYHHFLLPSEEGTRIAGFAVSRGPWFFRIGAWKTTEKDVSWSGVFGPLAITTNRQMNSKVKGEVQIVYTQPIEGGLRIHTGVYNNRPILVEYTSEPSFTIEKMRYRWVRDMNMFGYVDITGMEASYVYNVRIAQVEEPKDSIVEPCEWLVSKGQKALAPIRHHSNQHHALNMAGRTLLQEARTRPIRFHSSADYTRFLAIQQQAKGSLQRNS